MTRSYSGCQCRIISPFLFLLTYRETPSFTEVFKLEDVTPHPLTAFTEKDRNLKFDMNVHHDGKFGAIETIFEFTPLG